MKAPLMVVPVPVVKRGEDQQSIGIRKTNDSEND